MRNEQAESVLSSIREGRYTNQDVWPTAATHGTVAAAREAREAYNAQTKELERALKRDLELAYGLTQHSKAQRLWDLAWNYGHSASLEEVAVYYDEMADLLLFSC